jgi:hypothetical protein
VQRTAASVCKKPQFWDPFYAAQKTLRHTPKWLVTNDRCTVQMMLFLGPHTTYKKVAYYMRGAKGLTAVSKSHPFFMVHKKQKICI